MPSPKVPLFQTASPRLVTEVPSPEPQVPQPLSLVTPMTERRPELDFPVEPELPSQEPAEPWSVLLPVVEEPTSPSARPETHTTDGRQREEEHGQELEVLPWTPLTILMVVVTSNTLVTPQLSADTLLAVKRLVSWPPEEPVLLEEVERISRFRRSDDDEITCEYSNHKVSKPLSPTLFST